MPGTTEQLIKSAQPTIHPEGCFAYDSNGVAVNILGSNGFNTVSKPANFPDSLMASKAAETQSPTGLPLAVLGPDSRVNVLAKVQPVIHEPIRSTATEPKSLIELKRFATNQPSIEGLPLAESDEEPLGQVEEAIAVPVSSKRKEKSAKFKNFRSKVLAPLAIGAGILAARFAGFGGSANQNATDLEGNQDRRPVAGLVEETPEPRPKWCKEYVKVDRIPFDYQDGVSNFNIEAEKMAVWEKLTNRVSFDNPYVVPNFDAITEAPVNYLPFEFTVINPVDPAKEVVYQVHDVACFPEVVNGATPTLSFDNDSMVYRATMQAKVMAHNNQRVTSKESATVCVSGGIIALLGAIGFLLALIGIGKESK